MSPASRFVDLRVVALVLFAAAPAVAGLPASTGGAATVAPRVVELEFSSAHCNTTSRPVDGWCASIRRGLRSDLDVGVTVVADRAGETVLGMGFDSNWRLTEGRSWTPAAYLRTGVTAGDVRQAGRLDWDGVAAGVMWTFARRTFVVEGITDFAPSDESPTGLVLVWMENLTADTRFVVEADAIPFADGNAWTSAVAGFARTLDGWGEVSVGLRVHDGATGWSDTEIALGLTR